mmetsp:Transcript_36225/g.81845  ORF Transcript_36225/g.81845 Transcript_36225/m.81845 type:complete len:85 (+) Transcript_36225:320-574(+)
MVTGAAAEYVVAGAAAAYVVGDAIVYMAGVAAENVDAAIGAAATEYVETGAAATDAVTEAAAGAVMEATDADMTRKGCPAGKAG